ncbi:MAG: glycoside hydrolase family 32 protein [Eubacteriales bacterium]|nr:glycoside hydrolase family 32 protein [Eubacteriales bacterium]
MKEEGKRLAERILQEEREKAEVVAQDPWRLRFHLMPPVGWLNDPNGLCQADGLYHVFFQYSPFDAEGKDKFWGHYTSENLRDWTYRGVPLVTDEAFDRNGVYSGCAYAADGKLYLYYTGNVKEPGDHDYILEGRGANVILVEADRKGESFGDKQLLLTNADYPAEYTCHVRDPKVFSADGAYWMVLGGRKRDGRGAVLLYRSGDLKNWTYAKQLQTEADFGYMWECPDLFCLDGAWFLSLSPQGLPRGEYEFQNVYASGFFRVDGDFCGDCRLEEFAEWDKGFDFYAPQTFEDEKGRRILIGWAGLPDIGPEYDNPTVARGWQHALTVPRVVTRKEGRLRQYPVPELSLLRREELFLEPGREERLPAAFDLELELSGGSGELSVTIEKELRFCFDDQKAELSFAGGRPGHFAGIGRGRSLRRARLNRLESVRILADTSLVEIYVNGGELVFTTRYYPEGDGRSVLVEGAVDRIGCWRME